MRERKKDKKDRLDKKTISEMKRDLKDADITIKNNSIFEVVLRSDKNGGSYISLRPTEEEDITFSDLQSIVKKQKSLFEDFSVLIEDVYCPDNDNIGIEELEQIVGLGRIKKGMEEIPDEEYFDDLLSADCGTDEFFYEVDKMKIQVINRLIERAIYLYKEKEFSNNFKMSYLEKKLGVQNVFDDVDRSMKKIQSDVDRL